MLAVVVGDPHQHRPTQEGDEGQEGAATLAQGRTIDQQHGQGNHRQYHRRHGQGPPLRDGDHGAIEVELLLAFGVEHAPVGANRTFVAGLPRLVVGLDDKVVVAAAVEGVDQGAQVDGLVGLGGIGTAAHTAVARPADFRQQQWLAWELLLELAGAVEHEFHRVFHRHEFPVRQDVRGDQVDVLGQLRVFLPDMPLLTGGDRHLDRRAYPVQVLDQGLRGDFFAEQRLVAHHYPHHTARGVGQFDGAGDFTLVALKVRADPDAQGHPQAEFFGQARDIGLGALYGVDADAVGQLAHLLQVLAHLVVVGVLALLRAFAQTERRIREAGDLFRPGRRGHRAVDQRPEPGK
ncbi:hypothetical protein D3C76_608900 [compost metagenome]